MVTLRAALLVAAVWIGLAAQSSANPTDERVPISVAATIEARRVLDYPASQWEGVVASPDGSRYALLITQGDIARDGNWVELWSGELSTLDKAMPRRILKQFTSGLSDYRNGIQSLIHPIGNRVHWLEDNRTVVMQWGDGKQPTQLISIDTTSGTWKALTEHPTSIDQYTISPDGGRVLFDAYVPPVPLVPNPAYTVKTLDLITGLYEGQFQRRAAVLERETFVQRSPGTASKLIRHRDLDAYGRGVGNFSPDGQHILFLRNRILRADPSWTDYDDATLKDMLERYRVDPLGAWITQSAIVDLETNSERPLWQVPVPLSDYGVLKGLWTPDSKAIVIGPTFLPLPMEQKTPSHGKALVEVNVVSGTVIPISLPGLSERPQPLSWSREGNLVVAAGEEELVLGKQKGTWRILRRGARAEKPAATGSIDVQLVENFETAPQLVATEHRTGKRRHLMQIDPSLDRYVLGKVQMMEWKDGERRNWKGRLYYPVNFRAGLRYPLVVQTHGYAPAERFSLLGIEDSWGSVYAAQPLAARGMFVLQVQDHDDGESTPREGQVHSLGYESGVSALVAQGLVDRDRVGISGFSRSGWYVEYALAFSNFPYAAALAADNVGYGYVEATLSGSYGSFSPVLGGQPMGASFQAWLKNSVPFNADRIRTPLRLEVHTGGVIGVTAPWELFVRMRELNRPVELYVVPNAAAGAHPLQNAGQRLAEQQGVVDWFDFWLNDRERTQPMENRPESIASLQEQYAAWHELRVIRDRARDSHGRNIQ